MPGTRYAKSPKFASLSASERAKRIAKIRDPKKRKAAERHWGVERDGGGLLGALGGVSKGIGGFGRNVVGDVPQLASALYQSGEQIGRAAAKDVRAGKGIWKPGGILTSESEGEKLVRESIAGIPGQAMLLANPKEWYENPAIQTLNLAAFVLPGARAASVAKLSRSIKRANPGLTRAQANKAAIAESFNPGFARAQGLKGGIAPRVTKGRYGPEEGTRGRMPSRQPVMRGAQRVWDRAAERLDEVDPGSRWSASAKAQRAEARQRAAAVRLTKAGRQHLEKEVVTGLLGPGLGAKVRAALDRPGRTDRSRAAALVAGLEAPKGMTVAAAAGVRIQALRQHLDEQGELMPMQAAIDDLKRQRDEIRETDPEVDTTMLDRKIDYDEGKLDVLLGRGVPELDSPARTRLYNSMVSSIGRKAADAQIQQWDLAAWGHHLGNETDLPTDLYEQVVAQRISDPADFAPTGEAYFQRMRESDPEGWHFALRETLESMRGQTMQVGQLATALTKAGVKQEELRNSGLGRVFKSLGKSTTVGVDDVLDDLDVGSYFSRYDPDVSFRNDGHTGPNTEYGPHDSVQGPALVSREGQNGEYHEMVITLPDLEDAPFEAAYKGRGESHWGQDNVVYHVRFQVYEENGVKRLLIEEIQSDWASDYRRAKKQGTQQREPEEVEAERIQHEEKMQAAAEALQEAERAYDEWLAEKAQYLDEGTDLNKIPGWHDRGQSLLYEKLKANDDVNLAQSEWRQFLRFAGRGMRPSPMHQERYLDNALHNVMRFADEQGVDEVVVIDGGTQAVRNRAIEPEMIDDRDIETADGFQDYGEWIDGTTGEPLSNEQLTRALKTQPGGSFTRAYNEQIPARLKALYDAEPEHSDSAYVGRYSSYADPYDYTQPYNAIVQTTDSSMPGTVIRMTPEVQARMRESRALYQSLPGENTPRGATEFLADGRRRVTTFQGANATTWSHELLHVLIPDVSDAHRKTLEDFVGKPYAEWKTPEHEKVADAWDTYWREGHAPPSLREVFADLIRRMKALWKKAGVEAGEINPEVARTFDEMLGKRYHSTIVLKEHQVNQVRADVADLQKAIDSGDVEQMDEAVAALAELASQAEEAGVAILTRGKTPEQTAAILEGLRARKNAVVEDYRRRGLIDTDEDAKGYFPHMSMWEAIGEVPSDPVRMAATADVVGTPRVQGKTIQRNPNRLIRMQTGEVLNDPAVITYILRARLRLLETIRARGDLYKIGDPIERGGPIQPDLIYVRNPDVQPERMRAATLAANRISERDFRDLSARQLADEIDELNDVDAIEKEMFWDRSKGERPAWVTDEENVRTVPKRIASNRLGDVFRAAPRGNGMAAVGTLNALFRIASIYARPWRYIPVNYTQNAIMLGLTNPAAFAKLVKRDVARLTKDDPQLRNMIREQVGTIQATALPEFNTRPQTRAQAFERRLTKDSGQMGEMLGRYADVPIREAAWLNHATKYGFTDADDLRRLIEDPDLAEVRDIVAQRTKEDLIDFDTLTPWEKEVATRWLALWPFIRGITKWPFMYAREYPMRLALASLASNAISAEETDATVQDMGIIGAFGKDINVGKLDPSAPGREAVQNAVALMRGVSKVAQGEQPDLTAFTGNYLTPGLREMLGMATGEGKKNWTKNVSRTFVPGSPVVFDVAKGGSLADQALRQMGLVRERTDGVKREVKEWMAPVDQLTKQVRARGQQPPEVLVQLQKLRAPYGDWKQYEAEVGFAKRDRGEDDKLTKAERVEGLLDVAERYYPQLAAQAHGAAKRAGWEDFQALLDSGKANEEWLKEIDRYLYDQMFGAMEDAKRQAREAGYDVE